MNDLERFKAVVRFETPDYVPIFGFPGAPGMSGGLMAPDHARLVAQGMPAQVGGVFEDWKVRDLESWHRYWGTTGPITLDFTLGRDEEGFETTSRFEGDFETIESENGAITRQLVNNDVAYSMPQFLRYPVRDRDSWEFYRRRMTPRAQLSPEEMEARCRPLDDRTRPLCIGATGAYGPIRGLMGTEAVSIALYEDPELIHDIIGWRLQMVRDHVFPLIERLRPEVVLMGEDCCYNHGLLIGPKQFHEFCAECYREVCDCARANGADLVAVDTDGNAMEYVDVVEPYGVNAVFPWEVKAGNDLFAVRERHPRFVCFGWLEKEIVNEGNGHLIEPEVRAKAPLIAKGGYFPNGDHGIQPLVTFDGMRRFMTVLHEVTNNSEGEFPRY